MKRLILFLCFFVFAKPSFALENRFTVESDITYKISENGVTTVTQNFRLTNNTADYNGAEFTYTMPFTNVANIRAFDRTGALNVNYANNLIKFKFGDLVIGLNKTLYWTLAYETSDVAIKDGRYWKIVIPVPRDLDFENNYSIGLYIPKSFGSDKSEYIWNKSDLTNQTQIKLAFYPFENKIKYQNYSFDLIYPLVNNNIYPVSTEITLPPDTQSQKVILSKLEPKPIDVTFSKDNFWKAKYSLGAFSRLDVHAIGNIALLEKPYETPLIGDVYKYSVEKSQAKNIIVKNIEDNLDLQQKPKLSIHSDISGKSLYIENLGPVNYNGGTVTLSSQKNTVGLQTIEIPRLPPFASRKFDLPIAPFDLFTRHDDIITIDFENQSWEIPISIRPIYENKFWLFTGILFTFGIISLVAQIFRGIFVSRSNKQNNIHRKS